MKKQATEITKLILLSIPLAIILLVGFGWLTLYALHAIDMAVEEHTIILK